LDENAEYKNKDIERKYEELKTKYSKVLKELGELKEKLGMVEEEKVEEELGSKKKEIKSISIIKKYFEDQVKNSNVNMAKLTEENEKLKKEINCKINV
jgi:flagellar biosynthesis chaperone FliJ